MALTRREIRSIANEIEDAINEVAGDPASFEGAFFDFGDVRVRISEARGDSDRFAVKVFVTAEPPVDSEDIRDVQRILNRVNFALDGEVTEDNPRIRFNDDFPDRPGVTDVLRVSFTAGSGFDFSDI